MSDLFAAVIIFLTTMQETRVRSLGQQDPFEKGIATHSRVLAWRPSVGRGRSQVGYSPWGHKELDIAERHSLPHSTATREPDTEDILDFFKNCGIKKKKKKVNEAT